MPNLNLARLVGFACQRLQLVLDDLLRNLRVGLRAQINVAILLANLLAQPDLRLKPPVKQLARIQIVQTVVLHLLPLLRRNQVPWRNRQVLHFLRVHAATVYLQARLPRCDLDQINVVPCRDVDLVVAGNPPGRQL